MVTRILGALLLLSAVLGIGCEDDPIDVVNNPPRADAGGDRTVLRNVANQLSGEGSSDFENDPLTYLWELLDAPVASVDAEFDDPTIRDAYFTPDVDGDYTILLTVRDAGGSDTDQVVVTAIDPPPVAVLGGDGRVEENEPVTLDGRSSFDPEGQSLTYMWSLASVPPGSTASVDNPTAALTFFVPDLLGDYVVQLVVNDGIASSDPATVTYTSVVNIDCELAPFGFDFGLVSTTSGAEVEQDFTLTNTSDGPLAGTLSVSGDAYTVLAGLGAFDLDPQESRLLRLRFAPTESTPGDQNATVTFGTSQCEPITIRGTGQVTFTQAREQASNSGCGDCHGLSHTWMSAVSNLTTPTLSNLLRKPGGQVSHSPGSFSGWQVGGFQYEIVLAWIEQGALNN